MRFGSVAFFKVLIKTVLCIAFFVPLVLCVVFAVVLWNKSAELEDMKYENEKLSYTVELLTGDDLSVEEFYKLYVSAGMSEDELLAYIEQRNVKPDADNRDNNSKPDASGTSEDIGGTSGADDTQEAVQSAEPSETVQPDGTEEVPAIVEPSSEYADIHEDMTARVPATFVREENTVYLTFDDGPSENTYSVLYYLDKYDVKATFFVVPRRTEECYSLMKQIVDKGHAIGVHSASHEYNEIYSSVEAYLEDFYEAWSMIYEATGVKTEIFRFPGGSKNDFNGETRDAIIEEMTRRGFRYYDWNVDSNDVGEATWTEMYTSIPADIAENYRSIVLMHDSSPRINTVYVLEDILKVLLNKGYKLDRINNDTQPIQFIGPYA